MSTAANHRKRSHRSERMKRSALGNMSRKSYIRSSGRSYGAPGVPLLYRLQAMRRKILESRKRPEKEVNNDGK